MEVTPQYNPIGKFFEYQPVYRVATYQRAYSWGKLEIDDFIKDLETCYSSRKYQDPVVHFFGQIVCIKKNLPGADGQEYYEIVDGQQRVATFIILVNALVNIYYDIITTEIADDLSLNNQKGILEERIRNLSQRYLAFQKEIQQSIDSIRVLELSNRDKIFFNSYLCDKTVTPSLVSHKLIKQAYDSIQAKLLALTSTPSLIDRIGNLRTIELILENDFCILNMTTSDSLAAFKLFQVLNNRGKNLTEGDLLRAECLRMLESHHDNQESIEISWDNILTDSPADTVEYLRAIYGSYTGAKAGTNSLFNEFIDFFLPEYGYAHINGASATNIKSKVEQIEADVETLRKLSIGQWPYVRRPPIEHWDCNRLYLLINALDHKDCLPLLLSAQLLPQTLFNDIVQMLERFVFRYLVIGKQYIGDIVTIYHEEAKIIRDSPTTYNINLLQTKLQPLMNRVDNEMFKRQLDDFKYNKTGKSNKPLKYFLLSLEYFYRWYNGGAVAKPTCFDKERVYDFTDSSIEHIYPYSGISIPPVIDPILDPVKNIIGNLTILGNEDNRTGGNDDFTIKKPIFEQSSLKINNEDIASKIIWDLSTITTRTDLLKDMACSIFKL